MAMSDIITAQSCNRLLNLVPNGCNVILRDMKHRHIRRCFFKFKPTTFSPAVCKKLEDRLQSHSGFDDIGHAKRLVSLIDFH